MRRPPTLPPRAARRLGALACAAALVGAALASGCGQKGPLIRPDGGAAAGGAVPPATQRSANADESDAEAASDTAGSAADGG